MIRLDAVKHHFDANETLFLSRQLEEIESKLYEYKQRELKYREYIPVSNRDNPGAESITYRMITMVGMAKIIANYADDLPRADAVTREYTQRVKSIGASFGYSKQEIRAAAMANVPLETIKANAARRAIRELENNLAWTGDSTYGIVGFLNNTNIPTQGVGVGVGGNTWALKTAAEILLDISNATGAIRTTSKGLHEADTMLVPMDQYNILARTKINSLSETTILEEITKPGNAYGLTTVGWLSTELDNAFVGGTADGAVFYERDPEVIENRIPLEMEVEPVEKRNLEYVINVEARNGGVVVRYPMACLFLTGI